MRRRQMSLWLRVASKCPKPAAKETDDTLAVFEVGMQVGRSMARKEREGPLVEAAITEACLILTDEAAIYLDIGGAS